MNEPSAAHHTLKHLSLAVASALFLQGTYTHAAGLSLVDFNSVSAFGSAGAGRGVNSSDASVLSTNPAGMSFLDKQQFVIGGMGIFAGGEAKGTYETLILDNPNNYDVENLTPENIKYYQVFGSLNNYPKKGKHNCTDFDGNSAHCYIEHGKSNDFLQPKVVPSLYYAQPVTDQLWAGMAVYASFGGETEYKVESPFRYQALQSKTQIMKFQPSLSWRFDDSLAVGVGLMVAAGQMEMSRHLNPLAGAITDASAQIDGEGVGIGMNLGVIWKPLPSLVLGMSYRSPVKMKLEGDLRASGVAGLGVVMEHFADRHNDGSDHDDYPQPIPDAKASARWMTSERPGITKQDVKTTIKFPEIVDLSLSYDLDPQWTLLANATWTRWSRMEYFKVTASGGIPGRRVSDIVTVSNGAPGGHVVAFVPQNWSDVWSLSLGGQYQLNEKWLLRGGYAVDKSPTNDTTRSARIPDNDRQWLTLGARYTFDEKYSLDLAYGYMMMKSFTIHDANHKVDGSRQGVIEETAIFEDPGSLSARYRNMHAHAFAAQLTVRF
ncbi:OmpP1/FadL family transporter [Sansalvadorimonas verongulae]|uniref:OmpP1/FadL family transporter n=1 Tax=Sansalvadorimonas verongulae TaxID=2172824 RepID=UPI0012BD1D9D|nr:outer membrane protein transport protein [Sansalvadorimonas verongulae]MTI13910.1 transporter [Sansalvadorimonas verongulae]